MRLHCKNLPQVGNILIQHDSNLKVHHLYGDMNSILYYNIDRCSEVVNEFHHLYGDLFDDMTSILYYNIDRCSEVVNEFHHLYGDLFDDMTSILYYNIDRCSEVVNKFHHLYGDPIISTAKTQSVLNTEGKLQTNIKDLNTKVIKVKVVIKLLCPTFNTITIGFEKILILYECIYIIKLVRLPKLSS